MQPAKLQDDVFDIDADTQQDAEEYYANPENYVHQSQVESTAEANKVKPVRSIERSESNAGKRVTTQQATGRVLFGVDSAEEPALGEIFRLNGQYVVASSYGSEFALKSNYKAMESRLEAHIGKAVRYCYVVNADEDDVDPDIQVMELKTEPRPIRDNSPRKLEHKKSGPNSTPISRGTVYEGLGDETVIEPLPSFGKVVQWGVFILACFLGAAFVTSNPDVVAEVMHVVNKVAVYCLSLGYTSFTFPALIAFASFLVLFWLRKFPKAYRQSNWKSLYFLSGITYAVTTWTCYVIHDVTAPNAYSQAMGILLCLTTFLYTIFGLRDIAWALVSSVTTDEPVQRNRSKDFFRH